MCVGPNNCACINGWEGEDCSENSCDGLSSCDECSFSTGCGWCDTTPTCMSGDGSGPDQGSCLSWFYYSCITLGNGPDCSAHIMSIDCEDNQCDSTTGNFFPGSCPTCHDVEHCYKDEPSGCRSWDESTCPDGVIHPDYSDPTRILNSALKDNVKQIDVNDAVLYSCPALNVNDEVDDSLLIVTRDIINVQEGDIISSAQSEGILHEILTLVELNQYEIILGYPADFEDVIAYADFRQELEPAPIDDSLVHENGISDIIASELRTGGITVDGATVHVIDDTTNVYKCMGNFYEAIGNSTQPVKSYFIAHPVGLVFDEGDIIISNHSNGFLADVVGIDDDEVNATFVRTQVTYCSTAATFQPSIKTGIHRVSDGAEVNVDLTCTGGNKIPGLLILPKVHSSDLDISVGDTVVSNPSLAFIGKVVSSRTYNGHVFIELLEISTDSDLLYIDVNDLVPISRRKRFAKDLVLRPGFKLKESITLSAGPVTYTVTPKVIFSTKFSFGFAASWYRGLTRVGIGFDGRLTESVKAVLKWNQSGSKKWSYNLVDVSVLTFLIPVINIPACLHFVVDFKAGIGYEIKGSLTGEVGASASLSAGAEWRKSKGIRIKFPTLNFKPIIKASASFPESGLASAFSNAAVIPKFEARIPSFMKELTKLLQKLPWWLKKILGIKSSDKNALGITLDIKTSIEGEATAALCDGACADPKEQIRVDMEGGIPGITSDAKIKLFRFIDIKKIFLLLRLQIGMARKDGVFHFFLVVCVLMVHLAYWI
ncbi:uncharacterized protein LOC100368335 [Saccoglossus kowalevskii]